MNQIKFVIVRTEKGVWTIGHYNPFGFWESFKDFDDPDKAGEYCMKLNGYDPEREK